MTRIAPLDPPYDPAVEQRLLGMSPAGVAPIALFRLMAKNLALTEAAHALGSYLLGRRLSLSRREREIVIDRTCARTGCEYEWGVHLAFFADRVEFTAAQVTSLTHGQASDPCWPVARERLLIATVDALHDRCDLPDELWAQLSDAFDELELLDLLLLTGWYRAVSYLARSTRLPLEPGRPTFASVAPPRPGPDQPDPEQVRV